jgi:hypothetical protein
MKRCPTCNRSYADDTLSFCLEDGGPLAFERDPEATVLAQPRRSNSNRIYQAIIGVLLLTGVGVGLYLAFNRNNGGTEAATVVQPSPEPSHAEPVSVPNQISSAKPSPSPASNTLPPSGQPAIPKIYGKTYGAARKLLIQEGWLPNKRQSFHGQEVDVQSGNGPIFWKRGYWELDTCSGTGSAFCLFEFTDPTGRLLEVVTEGEEDEAGAYHAHVSRVYLKKK